MLLEDALSASFAGVAAVPGDDGVAEQLRDALGSKVVYAPEVFQRRTGVDPGEWDLDAQVDLLTP